MSFEELDQYYNKVISSLSPNTVRSYKYAIDNFIEYSNIQSIDDINKVTSKDIQDWMSSLIQNVDDKDIEKAKNSANSRIRPVKVFFNWLNVDPNPFDNIKLYKESRTIKVYATQEERDKMIKSCSYIQSKLIVAMAFYTGLRRNELANIKINDIQNGKLLVHGKGKKERLIPINSYLSKLISKHLKDRGDGCECPYLFVSSKNGLSSKYENGEYHQITGESIRQIIKNAAYKADIPEEKANKIAPHTCRRSFAIHLTTEVKASAFQVQKALGHSSVVTSQRYIDAAGSEIANDAILSLQEPAET